MWWFVVESDMCDCCVVCDRLFSLDVWMNRVRDVRLNKCGFWLILWLVCYLLMCFMVLGEVVLILSGCEWCVVYCDVVIILWLFVLCG